MAKRRFAMRLKALRTERGLSQDALARKVRFSRAYLARLEMGRHDPPLSTLTNLAKVLKVKVADLLEETMKSSDQPKVTARASRLKFDLNKVFPLDDPFSVLLLRLMIAVDDARHLQKLLVRASEDVNEDNKTESAILEGERGHLFRLLCGHLYEAGPAFRALVRNQKYSDRLDVAVASSDQAKAALEFVREAYRSHDVNDEEQGFWYSFLSPMRQYIGFHYKDEKVRETLAKYKNSEVLEGTLALVEFSGLGRYTVTDSLVKLVIADALGGDIVEFLRNYPELMKKAIKLAVALAEVVDHLLDYLFQQQPKAILEEHEDVIMISPSLQRAREQAKKGRRKQRSS